MTQIFFSSYTRIFLILLFSFSLACKKETEEKPAPTIQVKSSSAGADQIIGYAKTLDVVNINLQAAASEGLKMIGAYKVVAGNEIPLPGYPKSSGFDSDKNHLFSVPYTVAETTGEIIFKFTVTDNLGKTTSTNYKLIVSAINPPTIQILSTSLGANITNGTAQKGTNVMFNLTAKAPKGIKSLRAFKTVGTVRTDLDGFPKTNGFATDSTYSWSVNYNITDEASNPVIFTFEVENKLGLTQSANYTLTVTNPIPPTIRIKSNSLGNDQSKGTAEAGASIGLTYEANASEKIKSIEIFQTIGISESLITSLTGDFDTETKSTGSFNYIVPSTATGIVILKFVLTDKSNTISTINFEITVKIPDYNTYSAKLLAAPTGDRSSKSFFTSADGGTHSVDVAKANAAIVDFGYFFGATKKATFAAPADFITIIYSGLSDWGVKNTTEFVKTTGVDFSTISSSAAIGTAYDAGTKATDGDSPTGGATRIANLAKDQVIGFKTQAGKKGIIKIGTVVDGDGSTGSITFDVKVQK